MLIGRFYYPPSRWRPRKSGLEFRRNEPFDQTAVVEGAGVCPLDVEMVRKFRRELLGKEGLPQTSSASGEGSKKKRKPAAPNGRGGVLS